MSQENFIYDWDSLVIQISNGEEVHGSIRIMKQDLENMQELHNIKREDILELLLKTLETTENTQK
jgi:hypothetical protein